LYFVSIFVYVFLNMFRNIGISFHYFT